MRAAAALVASVLLAGCGAAPSSPTPLPPAPEPAVAPPLARNPAGALYPLPAGEPEGVAIDPVTNTVVAALRKPDRLALMDLRQPGSVRTVELPAAARHLQLAGPGGPVLVPGEDTDLLVEASLPGGQLLRRTKVGRQPHDAAAVRDRIVVADELGSAVTVLAGPAANDGTASNAGVGSAPVLSTFPGPVQPGGVAAAGARAAVVDVRGAQLYLYDVSTLRAVGRLAIGNGPTHDVGVSPTQVVVADTRGNALLVVDVTGRGRVSSTISLAGAPYGLAYDARRDLLWVTLTATNELVGFRVGGGALRQVADLPTVRQPNSVAVDPGSGRVVVAGASDSVLEVVTPP